MSAAGGMELLKLYATLEARDAGLKSALEGVKTLANEAHRALLQMAGVGFAAGGIAGMVKQFVDLEAAQARLGAVLSGTRNAVGLTRRELDGMAESMVRTGLASRQGALAAETALLRFTEVRGSQYRDAMRAAQSLSIMTGMDLPGAASMIGRMLEDPARGARYMRRLGLGSFSQREQQQIQQRQSGGDIEGAQQMLLNRIPTIQAPDTIARSLRQLGNEFADIGATIGSMFAPALKDAIGLVQGLASWFRSALSPELVASVGSWIRLGATVTAFVIGARVVAVVVSGIVTGFHALGIAAQTAATNTGSLAFTLNALRPTALTAVAIAAGVAMNRLREMRDMQDRLAHTDRGREPDLEERLRAMPAAERTRYVEEGLQTARTQAGRFAAMAAARSRLDEDQVRPPWEIFSPSVRARHARDLEITGGQSGEQIATAADRNQRIINTLVAAQGGPPGRHEQTPGHARMEGFSEAYDRLATAIAATAHGELPIGDQQLAAQQEANEQLRTIGGLFTELIRFANRPHVGGPPTIVPGLWGPLG